MEKRSEYTLIRSRRKTLSIEIRRNGDVVVRAPLKESLRSIDDFVDSRSGWIEKTRTLVKKQYDPSLKKFTDYEIEEMKKAAKSFFDVAVKKYSAVMGVKPSKITVRVQKTRWGSCSAKKTVSFNALLVCFPPEIAESVVVHELCHLRYMNHSSEFYKEVLKYCPDYKKCKEFLKKHGGEVLSRIT